jgi:uncharacterized membrane protein
VDRGVRLTLEKFDKATGSTAPASCDFSVVVQCSANLDSAQGSVFGFPNPILGLTGWMAPIVVGMAVLAGARFARWFWLTFFAGVTFAFGFVIWLITQSIFFLGTLCPWCMVTWIVTIPTFYAVAVHLLRSGVVSSTRVRAVGASGRVGPAHGIRVVRGGAPARAAAARRHPAAARRHFLNL